MAGEVDAKLREKGLTSDRIDEFRVAFQMFDIERVGYITAENIGALLIGQFGACVCCARGWMAHCVAVPGCGVCKKESWYAPTTPAHASVVSGCGLGVGGRGLRTGQTYTAEDLDYMLKQFSETGVVDFYNFALSMDSKMRDPRYNEAFADAFDLFDKEKKGELTMGALQEGMRALGETLTDEEASEMLKVCKTKAEFVKTMSQGGMVPSGGGGGGAASASSSSGAGAGAGAAPAPAPAPAPAAAVKGPPPRAPTLAAGRGGATAGRGGRGAARGGRGAARGARGGRGGARGARGGARGARGGRGRGAARPARGGRGK